MSKQRNRPTATKVSFQFLRYRKPFSRTKTIQLYLGRTLLKCSGLSSLLNFSKERSCLQYYLSNRKGFYDNKANFKINLESSLTNAEKELRSTGEVSATDRKNVEDRELLYLKDNFMLWNQKIGTLPSEIQQKFGILSQSSMQLGLDDMFCSVPNQVTSPGKDLLNLTVPDHEVTNDRLVAHFSPRALYEYLDEQYELQETNGGDDSASASSSSEEEDVEEDVEEDEEASSDDESVTTDPHFECNPNALPDYDEYNEMEPAEMVVVPTPGAVTRDPTVNWELIDRKDRELQRRGRCQDAMYDITDDLALVKLVRRH
eukprot:scaffold2160_cov55-Cylindrotheca_fusiformis.AAC.2